MIDILKVIQGSKTYIIACSYFVADKWAREQRVENFVFVEDENQLKEIDKDVDVLVWLQTSRISSFQKRVFDKTIRELALTVVRTYA